jgi:hypothetical protein
MTLMAAQLQVKRKSSYPNSNAANSHSNHWIQAAMQAADYVG